MKPQFRYQLIAATVSVLSLFLLTVTSTGHVGSEPAAKESSHLAPGGGDVFADVSVTKTGSPEEVAAGSNITYEITVINSGSDPAENANLSDTLPTGLTFVSLSAPPPGWTCMTPAVGAGGTVTCTNPSYAVTSGDSGDVFTVVVNVPVDAVPGTFFTNTATVSTTTFDPNDENNASSTATLVLGGQSADISVTKGVDSDEVLAGHPLTYTIAVVNSGPDNADNATLNDVLPSTVYFISLDQPAGWTCTTPALGDGGTVSCSRPSFGINGSEVFTVHVVVRSDTPANTVITNTATVSTTTAESSTENNAGSASSTVLPANPTAANGMIDGRILDDNGNPLSGAVVRLGGAQSRKTITNANGEYRFEDVDTGGFYTVTPSRANFSFNPFNRSFTQSGNQTEAVFTGTSTGDLLNPLDTPEYFVRQQYVDVLGREPEESGFNYWSDQINQCQSSVVSSQLECVSTRRLAVAAAFFMSEEFQTSGSYIYDVYAGTLGRKPAYGEYTNDRQQVVGGSTLEAAKIAFAQTFVQRSEFMSRYQMATSAEAFVDALLRSVQPSGVELSDERPSLIGIYNAGTDLVSSRAAVVKALADNATFKQSQYNQSFVLTEYFAYLRRDIDQSGYTFWLNVLNNREPGNYRGMVCSFVTSTEYQNRFSSIVSHNNLECGQ